MYSSRLTWFRRQIVGMAQQSEVSRKKKTKQKQQQQQQQQQQEKTAKNLSSFSSLRAPFRAPLQYLKA